MFCQSATIQSRYIQITLYMCLPLCVQVLHTYFIISPSATLILPLLQPDPSEITSQRLFRQEDSIVTGFCKKNYPCHHILPSRAHGSMHFYLPAGKGRSGPFCSPFPPSLGCRAGWEPGTSASSLSWVSVRMGRARHEQHEVWVCSLCCLLW